MKNRNALLGLVVAGLLAAGIIWWVKQTPAEKPAVASAKPATPVAAAVISPRVTVAAPTAPAVVPSANPQPATPAAAASPTAELNAAMNDLIATLQSGDVNAFVQNYLAPSMMEMAKTSEEARMAQNPNANMTPEMKAQMEKIMEQQMPMMIQQITQQLNARPDTMQGFQKMAAALQSAQTTPQMNDAGDRATYTLQATGDKDMPSSLVMVRRDGKWSLDIVSMMQGMRGAQ